MRGVSSIAVPGGVLKKIAWAAIQSQHRILCGCLVEDREYKHCFVDCPRVREHHVEWRTAVGNRGAIAELWCSPVGSAVLPSLVYW